MSQNWAEPFYVVLEDENPCNINKWKSGLAISIQHHYLFEALALTVEEKIATCFLNTKKKCIWLSTWG